MTDGKTPPTPTWHEQDSQTFIDFGHYFVPERQAQMQILCSLIPPCAPPCHIMELCCGEGLLAQSILAQVPHSLVHGFDGSPTMLARAQNRLAPYGARFEAQLFELLARDWRHPTWPVQAVLSSLALHHLDAEQKQVLYGDVYHILRSGGVFLIADLIQPAHPRGREVAARAWDDAVTQRAMTLDGHTGAWDYFQRQQWNYYRYPDPVDKPSRLFDQLKWLEQAGFVDVDVYWMQAGHAIFGGAKLAPTP
jgi:ubiquinone/menaquinone biosynthesis C-methylase UbiE